MHRAILALFLLLWAVATRAEDVSSSSSIGGVSPSGTFTAGDLVVGGPGTTQVQDASALASSPGYVTLPPGLRLISGVAGTSLYGWGNQAAGSFIYNNYPSYQSAPILGTFGTPSVAATYWGRDQAGAVGAIIGISNPAIGIIATPSGFTTTSVSFASPIACTYLHARSTDANGNPVSGSMISTNDAPKFTGEVTATNCSGGVTSSLTIGGGWFQVAGSKIATATIVTGGTGCTSGDVYTVGHPGAGDAGAYDFQGTLTAGTVGGGVVSTLSVSYAGSYPTGAPQLPLTVTLIGGTCATSPTATYTLTNVGANTGAGQTPVGTSIKINPNTAIFPWNYVCDIRTSGDARQCATELDVYNNTGQDDAGQLGSPLYTGLQIVSGGNAKSGVLLRLGGAAGSQYGLVIDSGAGAISQIVLRGNPGKIMGEGNLIDFYTAAKSNAPSFEVGPYQSTGGDYARITGGTSASLPGMTMQGSDTNIGFLFQTKGTGNWLFRPGTDTAGAFQVQNAAGTTTLFRISTGGPIGFNGTLTLGGAADITGTNGELGFVKIAASASAPGAAFGKMAVVCGTNAGSAKIIAYAGTSTTPVTIVDNVGSGVTGC